MSEKESKDAEEETFGILFSYRGNIPRHNHTPSTGPKIPPTYNFPSEGDDIENTPIANDEPEQTFEDLFEITDLIKNLRIWGTSDYLVNHIAAITRERSIFNHNHNHMSSTGSRIQPTYNFPVGINDTETTPNIQFQSIPEEAGDIEPIWYKEARRLFQLPCAQGLFEEFKDGVRKSVFKKLTELRMLDADEQTFDVRIEIADSIDLLRLLGASNPVLNEIAAVALKGHQNTRNITAVHVIWN